MNFLNFLIVQEDDHQSTMVNIQYRPNTPLFNAHDDNASGNVLLYKLHVYKHPKVNINSFTCPFQCSVSATWQHKLIQQKPSD